MAAGRSHSACSARRPALRPAASATTRNEGSPARTSSAWRPIEPVEPRTATPTGGRAPAGSAEDADDIEEPDRPREQERIDPIQQPAVARDEPARFLRAGSALEHRLREIAGLRRERQRQPEHQARERRPAERRKEQRADGGGDDGAPDDALERLRRRDVLHERVPPEAPAGEVRRGVEGPDAEDENEDPCPL